METLGIPRTKLVHMLATAVGLSSDDVAVAAGETLTDLGVDSIGVIEFGKSLEDEYDVELAEDAAAMTVDEIVARSNEDIRARHGRTDNSVYVNAPVALVWHLMNNVRLWPKLFTEYASTEVIYEWENTVQFHLTRTPDEDGTVWSWVSERTSFPETLSSSAHRVELGPFEYMHIDWNFESEDVGTRMRWRQRFWPNPGAPFDGPEITARLNEGTAEQMAAIKDRLELVAELAAMTTEPSGRV